MSQNNLYGLKTFFITMHANAFAINDCDSLSLSHFPYYFHHYISSSINSFIQKYAIKRLFKNDESFTLLFESTVGDLKGGLETSSLYFVARSRKFDRNRSFLFCLLQLSKLHGCWVYGWVLSKEFL